MNLSKINFGKAAGLVGGAVAAGKVSQIVPGENQFIKKGLPLVAGLFLSTNRNSIVAGLGDGMIAASGASLVSGLIPGIAGADVLMGDTTENFSSSSFDTTAASSGEMNY